MVKRSIIVSLALCALAPQPASAQLETEQLNVVELKDQLQPHWVWVNDLSFTHMSDGKAFLVDADTGRVLGMISGGFDHMVLQILPDGSGFAVPGTYMSRHSRGERHDVLTFYDTRTLAPGKEVEIPAKRLFSIPLLNAMPVTDDGRFSLIYNFTPEQSVTVVDMANKSFVGEYPTAGCGLIYPTGLRSFMMPCANGSFQNVTIADGGAITVGAASKPFIAEKDPVIEKAVRASNSEWLFFTPGNQVMKIDGAGKAPAVTTKWSLTDPRSADETKWRIGGIQPVAYHAQTGRLYVLMHEGGAYTHKDPGTELWVFDAASGKRLSRFVLDAPATAVAVGNDDQPYLYLTLFGVPELRIADPASGKVLRTVKELGHEMTVIQPAPVVRKPAAAKVGP